MDGMAMWNQMGWFAKISLLVGVLPLVAGGLYVIRPTERRLALMRPISLAGLFAAMAGTAAGFVNTLRALAVADEFTPALVPPLAAGASESLVTVFFGFACLTVAWLLVAVGMQRATEP
jgi:hypothetical protein